MNVPPSPCRLRAGLRIAATLLASCGGDTGPTEPAAPPPSAGGAATPTAVAANRPPSATIDLAEPSTGILRVTSILFRAAAADPDGDALQYAWDFGDGETVQADNVIAHAFDKPGSMDVTVTVSDKRGGTAVARRTVNVVRLTGKWFGLLTNGPHSGLRLGGDVAQAGRSFQTNMSAVWGDGAGGERNLAVSGVLFDPQDMSFTIANLCGSGDATYRGSWNDRLDAFSGDGPGCGLDYRHLDMFR
jgi:hypothetical protein